MAFVVGILQPGNHGLGRAHAAGKFGLGEAGVLAELKNLVGDFPVGDFFLKPSKFTLVAGASRDYIKRVTDALPPCPATWYSTQDPWGYRGLSNLVLP